MREIRHTRDFPLSISSRIIALEYIKDVEEEIEAFNSIKDYHGQTLPAPGMGRRPFNSIKDYRDVQQEDKDSNDDTFNSIKDYLQKLQPVQQRIKFLSIPSRIIRRLV